LKNGLLDHLAGYYWDNFNMADDEGQPERINGMRISSNWPQGLTQVGSKR